MTKGSTERCQRCEKEMKRDAGSRESERERERERGGIDLCTAVIACFILISVHTMTVHRGYIV